MNICVTLIYLMIFLMFSNNIFVTYNREQVVAYQSVVCNFAGISTCYSAYAMSGIAALHYSMNWVIYSQTQETFTNLLHRLSKLAGGMHFN